MATKKSKKGPTARRPSAEMQAQQAQDNHMGLLADRQHYREVVISRLEKASGARARMLRDRLVAGNAQIRDIRNPNQ